MKKACGHAGTVDKGVPPCVADNARCFSTEQLKTVLKLKCPINDHGIWSFKLRSRLKMAEMDSFCKLKAIFVLQCNKSPSYYVMMHTTQSWSDTKVCPGSVDTQNDLQ